MNSFRNLVFKDTASEGLQTWKFSLGEACGEGSEGSEERVIVKSGVDSCYILADSLVTLCPAVLCGKQNLQTMNLATDLKEFPRKVLKV